MLTRFRAAFYHISVGLFTSKSKDIKPFWPLLAAINQLRFTPCTWVHPGFNGIRVTRSLLLSVCFVDRCLAFCPFSFGHCGVCSSIYRFWLPLWYLQTLIARVNDDLQKPLGSNSLSGVVASCLSQGSIVHHAMPSLCLPKCSAHMPITVPLSINISVL